MSEWSRVREWILAALSRSLPTHNEQDIIEALSSGALNLWTCDTAAIVWLVESYPRMNVLVLWLAGGNLDGVKRGFTELEALAVDLGCRGAYFGGRRGWAKALPSYTEGLAVFYKELSQ